MPRRLPPAMPAAVVFDNDGLLLDTEEAWTRAEEALFARRGRTFTMADKLALIGSARGDAAAKLEVMLDAPGSGFALMDELHELVMEEAREPVNPRPGAVVLIAALQAAGVPMAVASNSPRDFLDLVLAGSGLLEGAGGSPFVATVAGDEVALPKPAPDIYLAACAALGADPAACVAFEDSAPGVAAARAAGIHVTGVPYFAGGQLPEADAIASALDHPSIMSMFAAV
ncbi:MAG: family phosphatase [Solirubrobacterales bacterium]|nr:family phosphatase [Solirubrobacterales bacterium]